MRVGHEALCSGVFLSRADVEYVRTDGGGGGWLADVQVEHGRHCMGQAGSDTMDIMAWEGRADRCEDLTWFYLWTGRSG